MYICTIMNTVNCYGYSDIGLRRSNNEDAFVINHDLCFFAVADGMGGAASGEIASQSFAETVSDVFSKNERHSERDILELVQNDISVS